MRETLKQLEIRVRTRMPTAVRQMYRMARSLGATGAASPGLPDHLVDGCRMCSSRYRMLDLLPKGGVAAELGTQTGAFAREMLTRAEPARLHVVDIDYSLFDDALRGDPRLTCHEGLTHDVIAGFPDAHFDWIYIDADHSYEGCLRDARASAAKLKPGGLLIFNDFAHIDVNIGRYGVHRAVVEFMLDVQWPMRLFAYSSAALYDVALAKPTGLAI